MALTRLYKAFFNSEKSSGVILLLCTGISLVLANSGIGPGYIHFWHKNIGGHTIEFWINDGLMSIFFLLIGLEIKREIYVGELSDRRQSLLPVMAAIGGMIVPALIYLAFNAGTDYQQGFGIPMATDIAFSLGILSLLGRRVPAGLKVFLTALAIIDDLGAIIVIAVFYSAGLQWLYLILVAGIFLLMLLLNYMKVRWLWLYLLLGIVMWYCMLRSGVHTTITGVLLAFALPFSKNKERSLSHRLEKAIHVPVAFVIVPLFALANTAILFPEEFGRQLQHASSMGIIIGLVCGKPLGIFLFSLLVLRSGLAKLPEGVRLRDIFGAGVLAGIGFTMSIFITLLAFSQETIVNNTKMDILVASLIAGIAGLVWLRISLKKD